MRNTDIIKEIQLQSIPSPLNLCYRPYLRKINTPNLHQTTLAGKLEEIIAKNEIYCKNYPFSK